MGDWGVRAHESDSGLNYLGLVKSNIIKLNGYKRFDVAEAVEYLKIHIIDTIRYANRGCCEEMMQEYIEYNFPYDYSYAVIMIAECLNDFFQDGEYRLYDYDADTERKITDFVFTSADLEILIQELQKILEPTHGTCKLWKDSNSFDKWQAHMKMLFESLTAAANAMPSSPQEGGGGNG